MFYRQHLYLTSETSRILILVSHPHFSLVWLHQPSTNYRRTLSLSLSIPAPSTAPTSRTEAAVTFPFLGLQNAIHSNLTVRFNHDFILHVPKDPVSAEIYDSVKFNFYCKSARSTYFKNVVPVADSDTVLLVNRRHHNGSWIFIVHRGSATKS